MTTIDQVSRCFHFPSSYYYSPPSSYFPHIDRWMLCSAIHQPSAVPHNDGPGLDPPARDVCWIGPGTELSGARCDYLLSGSLKPMAGHGISTQADQLRKPGNNPGSPDRISLGSVGFNLSTTGLSSTCWTDPDPDGHEQG